MTTLPPAGWYPDPDPAGTGRRRWWDGATWQGLEPETVPALGPAGAAAPLDALPSRRSLRENTAQPRPVPTIELPPEPDFTAISRPYTPVMAPAQSPILAPPAKNPAATAGLIVGVASVVIPGLIVAVAGLVASSRGLAQASRFARYGDGPVGRARAGWGLALSILGTVTSLAVLAFTVSALGYGPYPLGPQPQQRAAFVTAVHLAEDAGKLTTPISDDAAAKLGWDTCQTYRARTLTRSEFLSEVSDSKLGVGEYGLIMGIAESTICTDARTNMVNTIRGLQNTAG